MNAGRRFSQAISEGDGISLVARVSSADDAARVEEQGAEAVLVTAASDGTLEQVRAATSLPILLAWPGELTEPPADTDAYLFDVGEDVESVAQLYGELADAFELVFRIHDEEHLEAALEELDPEIFVLAAPDADGEEALEHVLDLLPDVPAGKLAIADLPMSARDDVGALERAGFDGVIVEPRNVADFVGDPPPDV
jgi:NAD(P)H-dependent flavin oxidoreductase YrpB (nitropropane dioxygenase family)